LALYRPAGVQGVAAAVSVGYTAAAIASAAVLRRRLGAPTEEAPMVRTLTWAVATSVPAGLLAWLKVRSMEPVTGRGALLPLLAGLTVAAAALPVCLSMAAAASGDRLQLLRSRRSTRPPRKGAR
jgi:putative peptidoglycan lipid II flippase